MPPADPTAPRPTPSDAAAGRPEARRSGRASQRRHFSFDAAPRPVGQAYSRYVRWLRLLLPTVAAAVVTLLIAWPQLNWQDAAPETEALRVRSDDGDALRMLNPRYVGVDSKDRPFTVTAESTRQVGPDAQQLSLEQPQADITLDDGSWVALLADRGIYDRAAKSLFLAGNVQLFHDEGYQFQSESARLDLDAGIASGDQPVRVQGPAGFLTGEGFRIEDDGQTVVITGRSALRFNPGAYEEAAERRQ